MRILGYEKCSCWWCFRDSTGYVSISYKGHEIRIPYCKKHGELAQEVIKEEYPGGKVLIPSRKNET